MGGRGTITTLLLAVALFSAAFAQNGGAVQSVAAFDSAYPFINYGADTLYVARDGAALEAFCGKMADVVRTRRGNVHIMHIGGSHVQAGTMSNRIRRRVLDYWGGAPASRGFIFPYSAANACNNPRDYSVSRSEPFSLVRNVYAEYPSPLGLCGISVYCTNQNQSITVKMNEPGYDSDTIILLGRSNGFYIDPVLKEDTIYHFPDETDTVNGRYYFHFGRPVNEFTLYFPCGMADTFFLNGILLKNGRPGITFSSIGVNGAAVPSYLRCANFGRDLSLLPPDLVIFGIGVNDAFDPKFDTAAFKANYLRLIARIREVNPECAFIFLSNNDTWKKSARGRYRVNGTGPLVSETMVRLANATGGAVWDQFSVMGGLSSMAKWQAAGLAQKDRVHFTADGYNLIGDLFYNAFIRNINNCRQ
ncbi:MAG: GDSL-type esterase/lipase family protein [Bacteroidales bacterium]|nr:GDSL-type esterase/lipase family protein [Bacteroidales bacterium]